VCQKAAWYRPTNKTTTNTTGVPNVKCAKVNQMYQNSLGMMPSVLKTDPIPNVPKCSWCTKRNDCNKHTENDQEWSLFARISSVHFYMGFCKNPLLVSEYSKWRTAAILKIVLGRIFCFPIAFWASTSGGFRIVSDTLVYGHTI